jgi:hypothetical protein
MSAAGISDAEIQAVEDWIDRLVALGTQREWLRSESGDWLDAFAELLADGDALLDQLSELEEQTLPDPEP